MAIPRDFKSLLGPTGNESRRVGDSNDVVKRFISALDNQIRILNGETVISPATQKPMKGWAYEKSGGKWAVCVRVGNRKMILDEDKGDNTTYKDSKNDVVQFYKFLREKASEGHPELLAEIRNLAPKGRGPNDG